MTNEKVIALLRAQSELEAKIEKLAQPAAHERKIRFADNADKKNIDLVELSMLNHVARARDAKGLPTGLLREHIDAQLRTMTSGGALTGADLVDTVMVPRLWEDVHLGAKVAGLFQTIDMPSKTIEVPKGLGDVTFYTPAGEGETVTATNLATYKHTLTAYPLKAQVDVSDELDQDAIIALMPAFRASLIRNAGETIDDVVLNADASGSTTSINYYGGDVGTVTRWAIGFDGIIHYCLIEVATYASKSFAGGAPSVTLLNTMLTMMGKYGVNPERVAFISDIWTWGVLRGVSDFLSLDKFGPQATLKTGQVPTPFGSPMVISAQIAKSAAGGYVHFTTNAYGRILSVNRDMWLFGVRKPITIATERSEAKGLTSIVVTMRIGLQAFGSRANAAYNNHTMLGYYGLV